MKINPPFEVVIIEALSALFDEIIDEDQSITHRDELGSWSSRVFSILENFPDPDLWGGEAVHSTMDNSLRARLSELPRPIYFSLLPQVFETFDKAGTSQDALDRAVHVFDLWFCSDEPRVVQTLRREIGVARERVVHSAAIGYRETVKRDETIKFDLMNAGRGNPTGGCRWSVSEAKLLLILIGPLDVLHAMDNVNHLLRHGRPES